MEVNRISAHIRFFKDIGGSWKSLELAAEADVTIMDDWIQDAVCQRCEASCERLYHHWGDPSGPQYTCRRCGEHFVVPLDSD